MKLINKIFALVLVLALVFSLAACGNDKQNSNSNDNSKPTVSTPSEDKTPTESNPKDDPADSKPEESKPEPKPEPKPESKPEPKPEPVKKTPAELIVGKWTTTGDIAPILADQGINVEGPIDITINTEFTSNGTLIERANSTQTYNAIVIATKKVMLDEIAKNNMTQSEFEAQLGMTIDEYVKESIDSLEFDIANLFTFIAEYKFAGDVLLVKSEGTGFVETQYTFINDNTLKIITDSEETIYTRVK